jgi:hypothetical protein
MFSVGTLSKFRRNDLIAALEHCPQQAQPRAFRSLSKQDLFCSVLDAARAMPEVATMVENMAQKIENPYRVPARK